MTAPADVIKGLIEQAAESCGISKITVYTEEGKDLVEFLGANAVQGTIALVSFFGDSAAERRVKQFTNQRKAVSGSLGSDETYAVFIKMKGSCRNLAIALRLLCDEQVEYTEGESKYTISYIGGKSLALDYGSACYEITLTVKF